MAKWYAVTDTEEPDDEENAARERIALAWSDADMENLDLLSMILNVARDQVIDFGPRIPEGAPVPDRFVLAQLMQAQNLWAAGKANPEGAIGPEGFSFMPRPLDRDVRSTIRPPKGRPHVL